MTRTGGKCPSHLQRNNRGKKSSWPQNLKLNIIKKIDTNNEMVTSGTVTSGTVTSGTVTSGTVTSETVNNKTLNNEIQNIESLNEILNETLIKNQ